MSEKHLLYYGVKELDSEKNRLKIPNEISDRFDDKEIYFAEEDGKFFLCTKKDYKKLKKDENINFFDYQVMDGTNRINLTYLKDLIGIEKQIELKGRGDRIYIQPYEKIVNPDYFFGNKSVSISDLAVKYSTKDLSRNN